MCFSFAVLNNQGVGTRIESKVDALTAQVGVMFSSFQQFHNLSRRDRKDSMLNLENEACHRASLEGCRRSAKKLLSMASSVVGALTDASSVVVEESHPGSEFELLFTDQQRRLVQKWLFEPAIDEFEDNEDEAALPLTEISAEGSDSDLEAELIEHWQKKGTQKLSEGQYSEAVPYLERALQRAELKHGEKGHFEGRDGTLELLAIAYCHQGRLKDAEDRLSQFSEKYEGKIKVLDVLLSAHCERGQWDQAEELVLKHTDIQRDESLQRVALRSCRESKWNIAGDILRKHRRFEGRDEIVKLVAHENCQKGQWEVAERFLLEHVEAKAERDIQCLESLHMLAELYLRRRDLELATRFGKRALESRGKALGRVHNLFLDTVLLLVEIYIAKGEILEADGYTALLYPSEEHSCKAQGSFLRGPSHRRFHRPWSVVFYGAPYSSRECRHEHF